MTSSKSQNPESIHAATTGIVGIGASAGGLQPIEAFLAHVPANSNLAYVVVQHLASTQETLLPDLLRRVTPMPVHEAAQGTRIEANCVYVITPDTELEVANGCLLVGKSSEPHGLRLPIDVLFCSLAAEQKTRAIAVVLSGMGSDGTLGLEAIKAAGGLGAVQQPDTAQFDGMPKSAIAAGCADIVAPPADLPQLILNHESHHSKPDSRGSTQSTPVVEIEPLARIIAILKRETQHDFSLYKRPTLLRRIERRMDIHHVATQTLYADLLEQSSQEADLLFNELLIGVTRFFRDPKVWQFLKDSALPELLARRPAKQTLRAWIVGCSTGEEAYSLAITFAEAVHESPQYSDLQLQIFASDVSSHAIETARRGRYPKSIEADVSAARLARYFSTHDDYYQIKGEIRDTILFAVHDVILHPPFTKLDLLFCRNLLIYFDTTLQRRLLPLFHYSLRPDGLLLLGSAETVGPFTELLTPIQANLRFYLSQNASSRRQTELFAGSFPPLNQTSEELAMSMSPTTTSNPMSDKLRDAADQVLLQVYAPAAVVINSDADILHISGRTGKYLELAAGKVNWNFYAMVRDGLRNPIAAAVKKAATQVEPVMLHGLNVMLSGGATQSIDVTVQTFSEPMELRGLTMVIFRDMELVAQDGKPSKAGKPLASAEKAAMQRYNDEIQTLREEARASKEELQSSNEELQSTNEELQSTNEELTTSKEEMQSMNEELQTINSEMQTRLDDLALAQSDMKNLLNSIEIAILFLDRNLSVRRFTEFAAKIINIRESDVGRPLSDLTTSLKYPGLHDDAQETLRTLAFHEKQVEAVDGKWFTVRIMPYRRVDNMIDGVVVTLIDITKAKKLESTLRNDAND